MENQVEYGFASEQLAYRFLNTVMHLPIDLSVAKLGRDDSHVKVRYRIAVGEFDTTLSKLDDLAAELGGEEAH